MEADVSIGGGALTFAMCVLKRFFSISGQIFKLKTEKRDGKKFSAKKPPENVLKIWSWLTKIVKDENLFLCLNGGGAVG